MNHTPTPWKTRPSDTVKNKNGTYTASIDGEIFSFVNVTAAGTYAKEEAEATAHFIVTACNAYDELLAALEEIACGNYGKSVAVKNIARAAIAKAKGES